MLGQPAVTRRPVQHPVVHQIGLLRHGRFNRCQVRLLPAAGSRDHQVFARAGHNLDHGLDEIGVPSKHPHDHVGAGGLQNTGGIVPVLVGEEHLGTFSIELAQCPAVLRSGALAPRLPCAEKARVRCAARDLVQLVSSFLLRQVLCQPGALERRIRHGQSGHRSPRGVRGRRADRRRLAMTACRVAESWLRRAAGRSSVRVVLRPRSGLDLLPGRDDKEKPLTVPIAAVWIRRRSPPGKPLLPRTVPPSRSVSPSERCCHPGATGDSPLVISRRLDVDEK